MEKPKINLIGENDSLRTNNIYLKEEVKELKEKVKKLICNLESVGDRKINKIEKLNKNIKLVQEKTIRVGIGPLLNNELIRQKKEIEDQFKEYGNLNISNREAGESLIKSLGKNGFDRTEAEFEVVIRKFGNSAHISIPKKYLGHKCRVRIWKEKEDN